MGWLMPKVVIPSSTLLIKSSLDCWKNWSRVEFHWKVAFCFASSQNGSMIGLVEYAHAIWFTSPNHDLAFVRSVGFGKFLIVDNIWLDGAIPVGVNFSPANSTVSLQNLNFLSLVTIPAITEIYVVPRFGKTSLLYYCHIAKCHLLFWVSWVHLWSLCHNFECIHTLMLDSLGVNIKTCSIPTL